MTKVARERVMRLARERVVEVASVKRVVNVPRQAWQAW